MPVAYQTARSFARRRQKRGFYVDEAEAEAAYIVTKIILTNFRGILEKFPTEDKRMVFYRITVGYRLKCYFSARPFRTYVYLAKQGIEQKFISLHEVDVSKASNHEAEADLLEEVLRTDRERSVFDLLCMGNDYAMIATKVRLPEASVAKIFRKIRRRVLDRMPSIKKRMRLPSSAYKERKHGPVQTCVPAVSSSAWLQPNAGQSISGPDK